MRRTKRAISKLELVARSKLFALCSYAFEVVYVVLPAVSSLVLVWESSVESGSFKFWPNDLLLLLLAHGEKRD
jgi:hypothetical protein